MASTDGRIDKLLIDAGLIDHDPLTLVLTVIDRFEQVTRPVGRRIDIGRAEPRTKPAAQRIDE